MTYNLFIDDERVPMDVTWGMWEDRTLYRDGDWVIARNWNEVIETVISLGFPSMISFDHDLGNNEKNGYEIAQKLGDMILDGVKLPENFEYRVHSKNPVGGTNIHFYMANLLKHVRN